MTPDPKPAEPQKEFVYAPYELIQENIRIAKWRGYKIKEVNPYARGIAELVFTRKMSEKKPST